MEENNIKKGSNASYILLVVALLIIIGLLSVLVYKAYFNKNNNNNNNNGSNNNEVTNVVTEADKKAILNILDLTANGYERVPASEVKLLELDESKEYIDISGPKVINAILAIQKTGDIDINSLEADDLRFLIMYYAINQELYVKNTNNEVQGNAITKATYSEIAKIFGITRSNDEVFPSSYRYKDYLIDHNEGYVSCYVSIVDSLTFTKKDKVITVTYNIHYERPDENNVTILTYDKVNDKTITFEFVKDNDSYTMQSLNIVKNKTNDTTTTPDKITEAEKTAILDILGLTANGFKKVPAGEKATSGLDANKEYGDFTVSVIGNFIYINKTGLIDINSLDANTLTLIIIDYANKHDLTVPNYTDSNGNLVAAVNKTNTETIAKIFGINTSKLSFNNGYLVWDSGFAVEYVELADSVSFAKTNNIITLTYNVKYNNTKKTLTFEFTKANDSYTLKSLNIKNN